MILAYLIERRTGLYLTETAFLDWRDGREADPHSMWTGVAGRAALVLPEEAPPLGDCFSLIDAEA